MEDTGIMFIGNRDNSLTSDYTQWLQQWQKPFPLSIHVPSEACKIVTPLQPIAWSQYLATHPDQNLVTFFIDGITRGFRIGFDHSLVSLKSARKNLESAQSHIAIVDDYLKAEITLARVAGPFPPEAVGHGQVSRFGVIPKNHQHDKWRLIVDLSYPSSHSVNDGIPSALCSLQYVTIDDAVQEIFKLGIGTLLAKIDIKSAFRLLPVHQADRHLLLMRWKECIYIDTCLPFGLRSAPKLFNILADLLQWIAQVEGTSCIMHYLDDFLLLGPPESEVCQNSLDIIQRICKDLGVPLALEKVDGPTPTLSFLGIVLDTIKMEARLPNDKLQRACNLVSKWLTKKSATKREILSLVGLLQHATKVVRCGRPFLSRMYATAAKIQQLDYYTRLNKEFRSDLHWWNTFLVKWNGLSLLRNTSATPIPDFCIQTDASGSWGCGAFFDGEWLQLPWDDNWKGANIMAKELLPILLSTAVWGPQLQGNQVLYQCDNSSVVAAIKKGSARDVVVMQLLRSLWFFVAHYDIHIICEHIAGSSNIAADHLSRNNISSFSLYPQASLIPTPLPLSLLQIVTIPGPDWTSMDFTLLFSSTILEV